ncbi:MAG: tetratricopeptide repeat protein [Alphaproteobacteria bacterium]|nr:tetratricopeptide repeat protein [Alphaproteobacteria bacterium]
MRRFSYLPLICSLALAGCASISPEDATMSNSLCQQGKLLLETHEAAQARDIFASATMRDPENARAWNGLGVADDMLNRHDEAAMAYKHALDIEPGNLLALNNMAHAYMAAGNYDQAVQLLEPHLQDAGVSETLKQNYAEAKTMAGLSASLPKEAFADLGSYPTQPMAEARLAAAKDILEDDADDYVLGVDIAVKAAGGTPVFNARIMHIEKPHSAKALCKMLTKHKVACTPHDVPVLRPH